jgi:hypothetical protein
MRYWGYLAAKLAAVCGIFYGSLALLNWAWPPERHLFGWRPDVNYIPPHFGYDLAFTFTVLMLFLLLQAAAWLVWRDHRYRCRVCLRRLRMPVESGSRDRMLQFGKPRLEYICPYGHGNLKIDELQILGFEISEWTPHSDDIWQELCAASKEPEDEP